MKPLFEIATGFVASLGMFGLGIAGATLLLTAEPGNRPEASVDVASLWTDEARKVDPAAQAFERIAAFQRRADPRLTEAPAVEAQDAAVALEAVDGLTTASLTGDEAGDVFLVAEEPEQALTEQLAITHAEWCANRYRSYRLETDSYISYDGRRRPCVSPYSAELAAVPGRTVLPDANGARIYDASFAADDPSDLAWLDGDGSSAATSDHVSYCLSRYRSYRPEDNSYQPYDGGPRRQCR
ncbi:BA14K family protein [Mesorhizobium sp. KR9-304]|uniref:BA14K family protein n=1 Tax=Mesorhizobium sp. KR9-304 TaxID=3156614 RepID=UPI0032B3A3CC